MCIPDPDYASDEKGYLDLMKDLARKRRREDFDKGAEPEGGFTGRPDVGYRGMADMCFAFSDADSIFYIGYSGGAGGMFQRGRQIRSSQSQRRIRRLSDGGINPLSDPANLRRPTCNCAEASAFSIAQAYDQKLEDLSFITFYPGSGQDRRGSGDTPKAPCPNCMKWIVRSGGYYDGSKFVCTRKDGGGDSGGMGGGTSSSTMVF